MNQSNESTTPQPELGRRLREIRHRSSLSLTDVAKATGISASFLSMVENGNSDISIGRLLRLTECYKVEIADVVGGFTATEGNVVRAGARRFLISPTEHIEFEFLAEANHPLRPVLVAIHPGGGMTEPLHSAGDVFLYMLAGQIVAEVDGAEPLKLKAGDSAYLPSDRERLYRNCGEETARLLTVVLRPDWTYGPSNGDLQKSTADRTRNQAPAHDTVDRP
jgi:transcriptional regulator with XRE-family HTH domain